VDLHCTTSATRPVFCERPFVSIPRNSPRRSAPTLQQLRGILSGLAARIPRAIQTTGPGAFLRPLSIESVCILGASITEIRIVDENWKCAANLETKCFAKSKKGPAMHTIESSMVVGWTAMSALSWCTWAQNRLLSGLVELSQYEKTLESAGFWRKRAGVELTLL
jgi:hypothetical protein